MQLSNIKKIFTADFWADNETKRPTNYNVKIDRHSDYLMVTTPQIIRTWVLAKLLGKSNKEFTSALVDLDDIKRERYEVNSPDYNPTPETIQAYFLAMVLDGKVMDVMRASEGLADILVSRPEFVVFSPSETNVQSGMLYIDGEFIHEEHTHDGQPS